MTKEELQLHDTIVCAIAKYRSDSGKLLIGFSCECTGFKNPGFMNFGLDLKFYDDYVLQTGNEYGDDHWIKVKE